MMTGFFIVFGTAAVFAIILAIIAIRQDKKEKLLQH